MRHCSLCGAQYYVSARKGFQGKGCPNKPHWACLCGQHHGNNETTCNHSDLKDRIQSDKRMSENEWIDDVTGKMKIDGLTVRETWAKRTIEDQQFLDSLSPTYERPVKPNDISP